jgi:prolyl oligopeptidase
MVKILAILLAICAATCFADESAMTDAAAAPTADPYLWLEDVDSERALAWVREHNARAARELEALPQFEAIRTRLLAVYDSQERIPHITRRGEYLYNFWRDTRNVRGVWRRTTLAEYRRPDPQWETVLDVDALAARENENWVWASVECKYPNYDRCLIGLSRGGGDTTVIREFDVGAKAFVRDGFNLPAAKTRVAWRDRDSIFVGTDFGPGSLTHSGYPRIVKIWQRGTPLEKATTVFEGEASDVSVTGWVAQERDHHREFVSRYLTFFENEQFLVRNGELVKLPLPRDARVASFKDQILVTLRTDWKIGDQVYPAGALLAMDWTRFLAGERGFQMLFTPGPRKSLSDFTTTRNFVLLNELDNIRGRLYVLSLRNGAWTREALPTPEYGTITVRATDHTQSDDYFLTTSDFLTPSSLYLGAVGQPQRELLKQLPAFFNAQGLEVTQRDAISRDGTHVPYFQISRKGLALNGTNPTLLTGYGGFQVSNTPSYSPGMGLAWLEQGGVYVLANIRGGGEFGPAWHQAALKENRQRAFDDFIAIAEDLIARKVTAPRHLGIMGGSNGGLLTGVMLTQRPDLFGAVVCQVPLLDMRRYHKLLAGASWMAEYGDPDQPEDWQYIGKYSPYHNVVKSARYPRVLFTTSTRDDRVHPGHARKMAARMQEQGHSILLYENIEGGHGGAANNQQQAYMGALAYTFLMRELR